MRILIFVLCATVSACGLNGQEADKVAARRYILATDSDGCTYMVLHSIGGNVYLTYMPELSHPPCKLKPEPQ